MRDAEERCSLTGHDLLAYAAELGQVVPDEERFTCAERGSEHCAGGVYRDVSNVDLLVECRRQAMRRDMGKG